MLRQCAAQVRQLSELTVLIASHILDLLLCGCPCVQSARTATNIERMCSELARDYPNLDPATFVTELGSSLEGLTISTLDLTSKEPPAHSCQ
jgi:hypothetical protein